MIEEDRFMLSKSTTPKSSLTLFAAKAKDGGVDKVRELVANVASVSSIEFEQKSPFSPNEDTSRLLGLALSVVDDAKTRQNILALLKKAGDFNLAAQFMTEEERSALFKEYKLLINIPVKYDDDVKQVRVACEILALLVKAGVSEVQKNELLNNMVALAKDNDKRELLLAKLLSPISSCLTPQQAQLFLPILKAGMDDSQYQVRNIIRAVVVEMRCFNLFTFKELEDNRLPRGELPKNPIDLKRQETVDEVLDKALHRSFNYYEILQNLAFLEITLGSQYHEKVVAEVLKRLNESRTDNEAYFYEFLGKAYAKSSVAHKTEIKEKLLENSVRGPMYNRKVVVNGLVHVLKGLTATDEQTKLVAEVCEAINPKVPNGWPNGFNYSADNAIMLSAFCAEYMLIVRAQKKQLSQEAVAVVTAPTLTASK